LITSVSIDAASRFVERLKPLPIAARRLLCVILKQAYHGTLRSKAPGVATMPEVLEACGVDVDQLYVLLDPLKQGGLIEVDGEYPFEEMRLTADSQIAKTIADECESSKIPVEEVFVNVCIEALPFPHGTP
jgi:hypothetical protein